MGNINAVPIVSQTKSLVQVIAGDEEGALATQVKFSRECPIVSQVNSAVHAIAGDVAEAKKIQEKDFVGSMLDLVNALPIIGHIKAVIHYSVNENDEGDQAMKSASRTTGTMVGGLIGSVGGPAGAVAGGVLGGTVTDSLTTAIDSTVHDEYRPAGILKQATVLASGEAESSSGAAFDLVAQILFDGLSGYGAAENIGAIETPNLISKPPGKVDEAVKHDVKELSSTEFRAMVYRHKLTNEPSKMGEHDTFEDEASNKFTHESSGKYIRDAVQEAIQKVFAEDVAKAKKQLEGVNKDNEDEINKAQASVDRLLNSPSRYEVHIIQEKGKDKFLGVPYAHLGWDSLYSDKGEYYAKFHGVCIVIDILPNPKAADSDIHSHTANVVGAYPLDEKNTAIKWKQVLQDSANVEATLFDIDGSKTVKVDQHLAQ